jgi:glycosyltransferase involved in cell wall biosynthesis
MKFFSVAIPTYEMNDKGDEVLEYNFSKLLSQSFTDFDVVITDHSKDYKIENLCYRWRDKLDIKYYRNELDRGNPASNTNLAIEKSEGKYISNMCQDDYFLHKDALQNIYDEIDENYSWYATPYVHSWDRVNFFRPHNPCVNPRLYVVNTIGTPSCVTIKNDKNMPKIDTNLFYAYDCEWYARLIQYWGEPKILNTYNMVNFLWGNSITSSITPEFIAKEEKYILEKYEGKQ